MSWKGAKPCYVSSDLNHSIIFNLIMYLPSDPDMLVSVINMKLRDGEFSDLEDLCACADRDIEELKATLLAHGYAFDDKQFKVSS